MKKFNGYIRYSGFYNIGPNPIQYDEKLFVGATQRTFVRALVTLYNIDGYNHNKMMQKLQYQSTKLRICNESKSYLALLEEIYNFKDRNEKLRFF